MGLIFLNSCEIACENLPFDENLYEECIMMIEKATVAGINKEYQWLEYVLTKMNNDPTIA